MHIALIYVYFGPSLPRHVSANITRNAVLFPSLRHVLVTDRRVHRRFPEAVETLIVPAPDRLTDSPVNADFRGGFWVHTLSRLRVLAKVHDLVGEIPILQVEGDVVLFKNFPFESLHGQNKAQWTPLNDSSDVAALMYFPSRELTHQFCVLLEKELNRWKGHTDMTILRSVSKLMGDRHHYLPLWKSQLPSADRLPDRFLSKNVSDVIFDAATIGMWLTGQDPRNTRGRTVLHREVPDHLVNPSVVRYEWDCRGWPIMIAGNTRADLCNLHVHSKNMKLFEIDNSLSLQDYIRASVNTKERLEKLSIRSLFVWLNVGMQQARELTRALSKKLESVVRKGN